MRKNPEVNLKLKYKKVLELSMVLTMVLMLLVFQTLRAINLDKTESKTVDIEIEVTDIPPTEQFKRPPPPPKPSIPIPSESEDIPEDLTIEANDLDLSDIPPPPPPPPKSEMEQLQDIIKKKPKDVAAHVKLAKLHIEKKEVDQAIKLLEIAGKLAPKDDKVFYQIGEIQYKQQHYQEALDAFNKAVRANVKHAEAHYYLCTLNELVGNEDIAQKHYQKAVKLDPDIENKLQL